MTKRLFALLLLGGVLLQAQSANLSPPVRAAAERITADGLARDLAYLSSDALKGRNTPSPGFDMAAAFITARLKKAGLEPAGDDGTFFQHYTMRESQVDTAAA